MGGDVIYVRASMRLILGAQHVRDHLDFETCVEINLTK